MRLLVAVVSVLLALGVSAAERWRIEIGASQIGFEYVIDGRPAVGEFTRFSAAGTLDPDRPETASFELRIDTASIDLGSRLISAFATSAEWFDSKTYPEAVFRLVELRPTPDGFRATGDLTIKGRKRRIAAPMQVSLDAAAARASGALTLDRRDFGLGLGPSALIVSIAPEVTVRFALEGAPLP
ncbi:MAG: YceI family protein [Paracoccaceae bacterium]